MIYYSPVYDLIGTLEGNLIKLETGYFIPYLDYTWEFIGEL